MTPQSHTIIFVDDEEHILNSLKRTFRKDPYTIIATTSVAEVLQTISKAPVALVISDQRMPEMKGTELIGKIKDRSPDTIRIILTGYADLHGAMDAINRGEVYRFITKPWDDEDIRTIVAKALEYYDIVMEYRRLQAITQKQNLELRELNENLETKVRERTTKIANLNAEIKESFLSLIRTLAGAMEMHSHIVGNHSKRVANLSKALATKMDISNDELFSIETAAVLHDIGKIAIPDSILKKSEAVLTRQESELMRRHPELGEAVIGNVKGLRRMAIIIRHHHERYDGSGYPDGLRGDDIPIGSRIVAIADAYDKMLNTKGAMSSTTPEKVLKHIESNAATAFDPDILLNFKEMISRGKESDAVEVEVGYKDLHEGMTLTRDIMTAKGVLLLPKGSILRENLIEKIQAYRYTDPIVNGIFVRRASVTNE